MNLLDFFRKKEKRKRLVDSAVKPRETAVSEKQIDKKTEPEKALGESKNAALILQRPKITEKSSLASEGGVYSFHVSKNSSKQEIKQAVEELYKVNVERVRVINMPHRLRSFGRKFGRRPGYRKALVKIADGEKIEFV